MYVLKVCAASSTALPGLWSSLYYCSASLIHGFFTGPRFLYGNRRLPSRTCWVGVFFLCSCTLHMASCALPQHCGCCPCCCLLLPGPCVEELGSCSRHHTDPGPACSCCWCHHCHPCVWLEGRSWTAPVHATQVDGSGCHGACTGAGRCRRHTGCVGERAGHLVRKAMHHVCCVLRVPYNFAEEAGLDMHTQALLSITGCCWSLFC